jgi:hypothetical protein
LVLRKESGAAWVVVNKDLSAAQDADLPADARGRRVLRPCVDVAAPGELAGSRLALAPAEVAFIV